MGPNMILVEFGSIIFTTSVPTSAIKLAMVIEAVQTMIRSIVLRKIQIKIQSTGLTE